MVILEVHYCINQKLKTEKMSVCQFSIHIPRVSCCVTFMKLIEDAKHLKYAYIGAKKWETPVDTQLHDWFV